MDQGRFQKDWFLISRHEIYLIKGKIWFFNKKDNGTSKNHQITEVALSNNQESEYLFGDLTDYRVTVRDLSKLAIGTGMLIGYYTRFKITGS